MKIAAIIVLLVAANGVWLWLLAEMRSHGYAVSYVNFLADLKSIHRLIVDERAAHRRHVLTFALISLYALIAALLVAVIL